MRDYAAPRLFAVMLAALVVSASGVQAGTIVDRIKAQGVIRCGAKPRPGLLTVVPDGRAFGLFLDVCRAIGAGVLGPQGKVEFHQYDSAKAYDAVRDGDDDVFFLDGSEITGEPGVAGAIVPGPPVFYMTTSVMVSAASPVQHVAELAGQPICFSQGSNAHRQLEAWFAAHHLDFVRMGYQEDVELHDTYNVQVCRAIAEETTTLADVRLDRGPNDLHSRLLPEPLAIFPVMASTGPQDPEWSAIVAWSIYSLIRAEAPAADWESGGVDAMPIDAPKWGLDRAWQARVVAAAGSYGDIFVRNLGDGSPFKLARGPNASWRDGGLFAPPYAD